MENPSASRGPSKLEQAQQQVNEVVGIMRVNVEKVLERDQKLSELDSRADALQEGGKRFEQQAQKLKRKYWWKNIKMMIIIVSLTGGGESTKAVTNASPTAQP
nr:synaptobrevin-1-like [Leptinotarsa decemlineata]